MKTSKFLVSALVSGMVLMSSVFATEGNLPGKVPSSANDVRNQIVSALSDVSATGQEVLIRFAVTEKKGFELLNVEGVNLEVVDRVKSELATERINVPADMAGVYSIRVRFSESAESKTDASAVLRDQIADALSGMTISEPGSVKVAFSVLNNTFKLKRVEGSNPALVSDVKLALSRSAIVPPAEVAGNYQVVVKF